MSLQTCRQLICKVEEINITLRKHLAKEEAQLLPLLLQHFSHAEQAELVAQFLYCIPLDTVERVLSWLKPMVPMAELLELMQHLQDVIPDQLLLQLLVTWLNPVPCGSAVANSSPPAAVMAAGSNSSSPTAVTELPCQAVGASSRLVICPFASASVKQPVAVTAGAKTGSDGGSSAPGKAAVASASQTAQQWPPLRVSAGACGWVPAAVVLHGATAVYLHQPSVAAMPL